MEKKCLAGLLICLGVLILSGSAGAAERRYTDLPPDSPYAPAVEYCAEQGWIQGTGDGAFSPDRLMTRAMLVQVLANRTSDYQAEDYNRYAGLSSINNRAYADVSPQAWYAQAVDWARTMGLVRGVGEDRFEPDRPLTREEFAQLLYVYAYRTGNRAEGSAGRAAEAFSDFSECYASTRDAVNWAVEEGLLTGFEEKLSPKAGVTRAQAALVFYRAKELLQNDTVAILFDLDPEEVVRLEVRNGNSGRTHEFTDPDVIREVVEKFNSFRYSEAVEETRSGWTMALNMYGKNGKELVRATVKPDALDFASYLYIGSTKGVFTWEWMQSMLEPPAVFQFEENTVERIVILNRQGECLQERDASPEERADIVRRLNAFRSRASYPQDTADGALSLEIYEAGKDGPARISLDTSSAVWNGTVYESYTGNCFPKVWRNELLGTEEVPFDENAVREGEALFHFDLEDVEEVCLSPVSYGLDGVSPWRPDGDAAKIEEAVKRLNAFRYVRTAQRTGSLEGADYGIQLSGKRLTNWWYYIGPDFIEWNGTVYYAGENAPCFTEEWLASRAFQEN